MILRRGLLRILIVGITLWTASCSLSPFQLLLREGATPGPALELRRCDEVQDVLCLVTFGIEPPDQMVIVLLTTPGLPDELQVVVTREGAELTYPCVTTEESPTVVYCMGPQLDLGSSLHIDVRALEEQTLLAAGDFVLSALALPTVPVGGVALPTIIWPTPRLTRTPELGTAYPNPEVSTTPTRTPLRFPSSTPGIKIGSTPTPTRTPAVSSFPSPRPTSGVR